MVETNLGKIELKFFPEVAPNHVYSFIALAKEGSYDGTIFHRVIPGVMIQGGDPECTVLGRCDGKGDPGYSLQAEFNDKPHKRGILSMFRDDLDPNSAGSQFFICVADAPHLDRKYTVFGGVVSGMEVVDQIVNQPRDRDNNPKPRIEVKIKIIEN